MLDALRPRISKLVRRPEPGRPPLPRTACASAALRIDALRSSIGVSRSGIATLRSRSGGGVAVCCGGAGAATVLPFFAAGARLGASAAGRFAGTVLAGGRGRRVGAGPGGGGATTCEPCCDDGTNGWVVKTNEPSGSDESIWRS